MHTEGTKAEMKSGSQEVAKKQKVTLEFEIQGTRNKEEPVARRVYRTNLTLGMVHCLLWQQNHLHWPSKQPERKDRAEEKIYGMEMCV